MILDLPEAVAPARATSAWWHGAAIYQIYPRSFADSDGDGVGDLRGIIGKLDYIVALGVDIVWISPFYRSPMKDFGYDVADYRAIDPLFGRASDFDTLVSRAHALDLKIMIDQVWSHTSDQHAWFEESRGSREGTKANWFVWADAKPDGSPPNNWLSVFGGSAWSWDTRRRQYYLHHFLPSQPQLNLYNKEVVAALMDAARFWLDRGVDGFRLDAIDFMFHDRALRDNPPRGLGGNTSPARPFGMQLHRHDMLQADTLSFIARLRHTMRDYPGTITLGEVSSEEGAFARCALYTDVESDRLDMAYTLALMKQPLDSRSLREALAECGPALESGSVCWAFSNHDVMRAVTRWGVGREEESLARMLLVLLGCLPGVACLYQGEELGLGEATLAPDEMRDPYGLNFYPAFAGRDGCRTPMPWHGAEPFGDFTRGAKPWLPVPPEHLAKAVDRQVTDPHSVLHTYRHFLAWRRAQPALRDGKFRLHSVPEPLFAIERIAPTQRILAVYNLGVAPVTLAASHLPAHRTINLPGLQPIIAVRDEVVFPPYGILLGLVQG